MAHMNTNKEVGPTVRSGKPKVIALVISAVILAIIVALVAVYWQSIISITTNPDRARQLITDSGPWGPVVFMLLQVLQVVVAPVPGQITGFAGGYLFGWPLGTLYSTIGGAIGFTVVFLLARNLGRPFVEYFFDPKLLKKFDYLAESKGVMVLFLIFLIPAFPDDLICYLAGLTAIPIRTLVLISLLGRLPTTLLLSFAGAGMAESNTTLVVVITTIMVAVIGLAYWKRKWLEQWAHRMTERYNKS